MREVTTSVIIPAYNSERFVARAIRSALFQTLPPMEVIVIDDGSEDRTLDVVSSFGTPVRAITQRHGGPGSARNTGIAAAKGALIAFLDSDDEWLPWHLANAVSVLCRYPDLRWCCTPYFLEMCNGTICIRSPDDSAMIPGCQYCDYFVIASSHVISMDSMVVDAKVFEEIGAFDADLPRAEDKELCFRIAAHNHHIGYASAPSSIYHYVGTSVTHSTLPIPSLTMKIAERNFRLTQQLGPRTVEHARPLLANCINSAFRSAVSMRDIDAVRLFSKSRMPIYGVWKLCSFFARALPKSICILLLDVISSVCKIRRRLLSVL